MFRRYRPIMMTLAASTMTLFLVFGSLWSLTAHVQASDSEGASLQAADKAEGMSGSFLGGASLPNGVAAGDVTQNSAVLWAHSTVTGTVEFIYSINPDLSDGMTVSVNVTDTLQPAKAFLSGLTPNTIYYYRATNATGDSADGRFQTAASVGTQTGLRFGVSGDWRGELSPYPSISNASQRNLNFFVEHGDTIYADFPSPAVPLTQAVTLADYRNKHNEAYSTRFGLNTWAQLRASTSILATIDDHEVTNDFSGAADADSDPRFNESEGLINDTALYENGLQAFQEYNPLRDEFYGAEVEDGDGRMDGERKLYRYQTYGSDAAVIILDNRSFRDEEIDEVDIDNPLDILRFLNEAFDPTRTMLGAVQVADLKADLLSAQQQNITWKFVLVPEPIQNFGVLGAPDRFEGYAAERTEILQFINDNDISNVVFIAADIHGTVVNNLTYQQGVNQPQIPTNAFEITTGSVAFDPPGGPSAIQVALELGILTDTAIYDALPIANDPDSIINDKDDFVKAFINQQSVFFGYDPVGLEGSPIDAQLLQGDYAAGHTFGWTEFEIDQNSQQLTVTTHGIMSYSEAELNLDPSDILTRTPQIVSQFIVTPTQSVATAITLSEYNSTPARATPPWWAPALALLLLGGLAMKRRSAEQPSASEGGLFERLVE
ncbi:MAG: alkaline phosphatase D family protein [Ardenticatenaceae bacterium]